MRPIKLSMTAFGPFVKTEHIDFDALGETPLFLINGATGSGKTTILDAICFALYGQTTGKEREANHMRCDYADDKLLTTVEFTFELNGETYRIIRIPEQQRAKAKGEGTTKQAASAELWHQQKDKEKLLVPKKVSEATQRIEELTGLQVDQFRQVMVLPQGQFRRLLMSDSKDREQIFSQLFETHVYKRIEDKLKALAKDVYIKVQKLKEKQQGILQSVSLENDEDLEKEIHTLKPEYKAAEVEKKTKDKAYLNAVKSLDAAELLAKDFLRLQQQQEKLQQLDKQSSDIKAKKEQVKHARLALTLEPVFNELSRCRKERKAASEQLKQAEASYKASEQSLKITQKALDENKERTSQLDELKKQNTTLQGYGERVIKLQQTRESLGKVQAQFQTHDSQLKKAETNLQKVTQGFEQSEKEKKQLEQALHKNADLGGQQQKLSEQHRLKRQYDKLLEDQLQIKKVFQKARDKGKILTQILEREQRRAHEIELLWHSSQAAILAAKLETNQPCPVCGSREHPQPAHATQQPPTKHEREQAQLDVETAQAQVQIEWDKCIKFEEQLKNLQKQLIEQQQLLGGLANTPLAEITQQLASLSKELEQSKQQRQQLETLNTALEKFKQEEQAARGQFEQASMSLANTNTQLQTGKTEVSHAEKELPEAYREAGALQAALTQTAQDINKLDALIKQTIQQHNEAEKAETQAKTTQKSSLKLSTKAEKDEQVAIENWQKSITESAFKDEQEYQLAHCTDAQLSQLEQAISDYESQYQQTKGALKDQQAALKDKSAPDIAALTTLVTHSNEEKEASETQWKTLHTRLQQLKDVQKTLKKMTNEQQKEEDEYKVIGTLSNVANGNTGNKISLQRFVLGVLLDDVLIEASQRLKIMSKGRYLLLRKEDRAKGNKASGLELEVEDSYTGKIRPVTTLSGGEVFMASLSLALGLSDVVQAYAGGIHLDTLFIDEGFGSLDTDSLDLAIRTLVDLRDTGRMVGIISHVSELKEQIALRLDVVSGREGSTIQLIH